MKKLSKEQIFWILQIVGWSIYAQVFIYDNIFFNVDDVTDPSLTIKVFTVFAFQGLVFTVFIRFVLKKVEHFGLGVYFTSAFLMVTIFSLIWTVAKRLMIWIMLYPEYYEQWLTGEIPFVKIFYGFSLTFLVLGIWTAFYFGIKYHLKFVEQSHKISEIKADHERAKLALLRYQLNPHFLFNSLNAASNLALRGDGEKTSDMLAKLSNFLRFSLDNSPNDKSTLKHDFTVMKEYLEIERIRFGERLKVDWQIEPAAMNIMIPSFLIQPLIENVIKHALSQLKENAVLTIKATVINNKLSIVVEDNGPLTELNKVNDGKGIGLKNIKQRLELFYGQNYQLKLSINKPQGLHVEIVLPVTSEA